MTFIDFIKTIYRCFLEPPLSNKAESSQQILAASIENAVLIIMTASENAIELDEETIATVIQAKNAIKDGPLESTLEGNFWMAYQRISNTLSPISVDSIRATYEGLIDPAQHTGWFTRRPRRPLSRQCASNYKLLSVVTLTLLIGVQVYWYIGWSIVDDITAQSQAIEKLKREISQLNLQEASEAASQSSFNFEKVREETLKKEIIEHSQWKDAAFHHLDNWNSTWSNVNFLTSQPWQEAGFQDLSLQVQRHIQFVAAGNFLAALTGYILPILYGLIGACFFILRQLPKEIARRTFSMNSYINYSLRTTQGPLAGIMISFLFNTESDEKSPLALGNSDLLSLEPSFASLSPLALAFLAGYSVEFVFRFIDRTLDPQEAQIALNASASQNSITKKKRKKEKTTRSINESPPQ
ncbi:hypothetical protein [Sneathiella sp.]|jgi:hypothetical protein|uniref:hypothetical protein n=1 Tax=Sneathiella sp. TaxID=1964365 RepID=UPI0039E61438